MKLVVCGSRTYPHREIIRRELERYPAGTRLAHGGCGMKAGRFLWGQDDALAEVGADMLAGAIGRELGFEVVAYVPPEWLAGNFVGSAGPKRNGRMLAEERPDEVLAFVEGGLTRGTADCVRRAERLGIPVRVISG